MFYRRAYNLGFAQGMRGSTIFLIVLKNEVELILKAIGPRSDPLGLDNDLQYSTRSTVNPSQSNASRVLKQETGIPVRYSAEIRHKDIIFYFT